MEVFLVRHGIAEDHAASDEARQLTAEGRRKTEAVAAAFRKRVGKLDLILHSPYLRAAETAAIFSAEFPKTPVQESPGITPYDEPESVRALIEKHSGLKRLMIVAHEPLLSRSASLLLTGQESPILGFKKAGIAGIEWTEEGGKLLFLLMPKFL